MVRTKGVTAETLHSVHSNTSPSMGSRDALVYQLSSMGPKFADILFY